MRQVFSSPPTEPKIKRPAIPGWDTHNVPEADFNAVYKASREEWNERYGDYISREKAWRFTATLALCVSLICAGALAYTSTQSKFIPYVVEVDKLGTPLAVQRADVAAKADPRIIRTQLARWITNVRTVYQDAGAERVNITEAYSMLRRIDPASTALNEYLNKNDPFEKAQSQGIGVNINSVMPISEDTWQVQWTESIHSPKGELLTTIPMQANLTVVIDPPTDEAGVMHNPMGVYIKNFTWSQRL